MKNGRLFLCACNLIFAVKSGVIFKVLVDVLAVEDIVNCHQIVPKRNKLHPALEHAV